MEEAPPLAGVVTVLPTGSLRNLRRTLLPVAIMTRTRTWSLCRQAAFKSVAAAVRRLSGYQLRPAGRFVSSHWQWGVGEVLFGTRGCWCQGHAVAPSLLCFHRVSKRHPHITSTPGEGTMIITPLAWCQCGIDGVRWH